MATNRPIDTDTLDMAAKQWAAQFLQDSQFSARNPEVAVAGREWVMQSFYNAYYKDEFEYLAARFREQLGPVPLAEFEALAASRFTPRSNDVFEAILAEKLNIRPDGTAIEQG